MRTRVSSKIGLAVGGLLLVALIVQGTLARTFMSREVEFFRTPSVSNGLRMLGMAVEGRPVIPSNLLDGMEEGPSVGIYDTDGLALATTAHAPPRLPAHLVVRALATAADVQQTQPLTLSGRRVPGRSPGVPDRLIALEVGFIERRVFATRMRVLALITLFMSLLALAATWWLTRRIRGDLLGASRVVRRVANGELDVRLPVASDDEVGQLARDFNQMAERLEQHIEQLRRQDTRRRGMFADWTHEIATPLSSVMGYLEAPASSGSTTTPPTSPHPARPRSQRAPSRTTPPSLSYPHTPPHPVKPSRA